MEIPGFTRHKSGGWVRSYKGKTIWCGDRSATREQVEATYQRKKDEIDNAVAVGAGPLPYRDVLSEFLTAMQRRVKTGRPRPMSSRTLHNYTIILNEFGAFVNGGTPITDIGPAQFTAFAAKHSHYKASGFDSIVTRISALFRWAVDMEYIDRFRPGPEFVRPPKAMLRDERIDLSKRFTPEEFTKLYAAANHTEKCWLGLGLFAAMTNSEIANLTRDCVDLDGGVIDFRRRKTGKIRRVCPLPEQLANDLRAYTRPDPAHAGDRPLFFLTTGGQAYAGTRRRDGKPSDMLGRLFRDLMTVAGVELRGGRSFTGLRTTFYNLFLAMPRRADYEIERRIIMGRAHGSVDLDSYLEDVGLDRLKHVIRHVEVSISTSPEDSVASGIATPSVSAPQAQTAA